MVGMTKDDSVLPSQGLGGASAKGVLLVVIGCVGAQTWLPVVGVIADMYRGGALALSGLNPLLFSYLVALGATACGASFARWRGEWARGVYGALAGTLAAIVGAALLLVPEQDGSVAVAVLRIVSGALLGLGSGLLSMVWSERFGQLEPPARSQASFLIVIAACLLAAFAQSMGIHWSLLVAVIVLSVASSALFMASASRGASLAGALLPATRLRGAFARIAVSYGLFGLVFAMMITQFLIARHGHALPWTWLLSLGGIVVALVAVLVAKAVLKQGFSWLLILRFAAIPILVAFYPFDAGSEFSLRFAMGASAVALWIYLSLMAGVAAEAAGQIHAPFALVWGVALGALALGAASGSSLALMMESLDIQGHVSVTAIAAMVLAVIASDVVLTRGSLARAYKRAVTAAGGKETEPSDDDTPFDERVAAVAEAHALTEREAEVLGILARGHGLGRVQEALFIAEGTAITHRRHIYQKLGVHSKAELIDLVSTFGDEGIDED
ncbi:helix-turn-helix transcriptional regulator [Adlercreutzia sp. R25]|uniref:Helix-turn-helix transcriptional regulator n=1 Tax=Adlercreutzia shanghongiae TaxID=3111773 RepID=A0ABU6IYA9_9ACTN|nr:MULTISPECIES: helix-turn-helix transcriptional regulator [unclassified Adlercreutzia]MEC4271659.1 helix-turn-helix transcriptional regulator [Adlercreutzia sp. R25]MEC4294665.1 helix-turn-helix transcriptional regulator [Adlercreutzia sp. R22]